jgi:uncharacterized protein YdbL (DUF1318 family)
MMTRTRETRGLILAALVAAAGACVPVTVNISFTQEKLDTAAKQIEDVTAQTAAVPAAPAATPPAATAAAAAAPTATPPAATAPAATPPAATAAAAAAPTATPPTATAPTKATAPAAAAGRTVDVTPRIDTRSPEVVKATESRRQRRPGLRELRSRGCVGESNRGLLEARPGDACGPEVADLVRAENADRHVIYSAFMKDNNIPASDTARVESAFAKARQDRVRSNEWIQLEDGRWVKKE